jgi:hypothetical protein
VHEGHGEQIQRSRASESLRGQRYSPHVQVRALWLLRLVPSFDGKKLQWIVVRRRPIRAYCSCVCQLLLFITVLHTPFVMKRSVYGGVY